MNWLISRLSEPSTGAGLGMLASLATTVPAWAAYADFFRALAAFGAAHAVVASEGK